MAYKEDYVPPDRGAKKKPGKRAFGTKGKGKAAPVQKSMMQNRSFGGGR